MKSVLRDHGHILHWAGGHHLFPVRGPGETDLGFAGHGELEGRKPVGWHVFFSILDDTGKVVVVDDAAGKAEVVTEAQAKVAQAHLS